MKKGWKWKKGHSEETKKTISKKIRELWKNPKYRAHMVKAHIGCKWSPESREKRIKALSVPNKKEWIYRGEKHWSWIKDRAKVIRQERNDPEYKQWRAKVLKKDNYTCLWCGEAKKVIADHIYQWVSYPRLRYQVENGQTLCVPCHKVRTVSQLKGTSKLVFNF